MPRTSSSVRLQFSEQEIPLVIVECSLAGVLSDSSLTVWVVTDVPD
jgi:hypothetical protein